jgi:hypothetical protein
VRARRLASRALDTAPRHGTYQTMVCRAMPANKPVVHGGRAGTSHS